MSTNNSIYSKATMEQNISSTNDQLAKLAGGKLQVAELFRDRKDGKSFIEKPPSMSIEDVVMQGSRIIEAEAQTVAFSKEFMARPNDGAVAFSEVISQSYGFGPLGKAERGFFGTTLPTFKTVITGYDEHGEAETVSVPWGTMEFAPLQAKFNLAYSMHIDYGFCFTVSVQAPKKMEHAIVGLFMMVEEYLKRNSIYRGKALYGVGRANPNTGEIVEPEFKNCYTTNRERIVYSSSVWRKLRKNVLTRITQTENCRSEGISIGAKVLVYGENGTGKTEFTNIVGQYAVEQGWGAIWARYDEDIAKVVAFAERLGTPTVVVIEDIEKLMRPEGHNSKQEMDKLLDLFDGAGSKGREVMLLMTSNHIDELTRSMTRAGRIDRMVHVGDLDREGVERLINVTIPADRREGLDYEALHLAYDGYSPAWIAESLKGLRLSALDRTMTTGAMFTTDDFVTEAEDLREAWSHHKSSTDRPARDTLGDTFLGVVTEAVENTMTRFHVTEDGEIVYAEL